jgi:hypothetical protein
MNRVSEVVKRYRVCVLTNECLPDQYALLSARVPAVIHGEFDTLGAAEICVSELIEIDAKFSVEKEYCIITTYTQKKEVPHVP